MVYFVLDHVNIKVSSNGHDIDYNRSNACMFLAIKLVGQITRH